MPYEDDYKMWLEKSLIEMNPDWICDGMADKEFTHKWCEENCGKDNAYIMPKCLHMYYHHIVRTEQTEPQTETQMKTQNSNLTFEKRTMRDCYNCKRYETEDECIECHYEPEDEPQTDCLTCRYNSDEWDSPKCDSCTKAHSNYEPQTDCAWK